MPDNAAFTKAPAVKAALLAGFRGGQNAGYLDDAFDTLYYHLLAGNYSAAQLPSGETNTLLGADITTSHLGKHFTFVTGGMTSNVGRVKKSIEVMNGVVRLALPVFFMPDILTSYTPYKHCSEGQTDLSAQVHIISVVLAPPAGASSQTYGRILTVILHINDVPCSWSQTPSRRSSKATTLVAQRGWRRRAATLAARRATTNAASGPTRVPP